MVPRFVETADNTGQRGGRNKVTDLRSTVTGERTMSTANYTGPRVNSNQPRLGTRDGAKVFSLHSSFIGTAPPVTADMLRGKSSRNPHSKMRRL